MSAADTYDQLVDELREYRRTPEGSGRPVEKDDPKIEAIFDSFYELWDRMTPDEREVRDQQGWRGWPDLYDQRQAEQST